MHRLRRIHLYLSVLIAPAMIFFAISGGWQAYRFQQSKKDGSYTAPPALTAMSQVHMAEQLSDSGRPWFRAAQLLLALAFVATAGVGIAMALRVGRPVSRIWLLLALGTALPILLAVLSRKGA